MNRLCKNVLRNFFVLIPGLFGMGGCGEGERTCGSEHFLMHIPSHLSDLSMDTAEELLAHLESVFRYHLGRGFDPLPPDDGYGGDDSQDVFLIREGGYGKPSRLEVPFGGANGSLYDKAIAAHELHHVFQYVTLEGNSTMSRWLNESTAQWMGVAPFLQKPEDVPVENGLLQYLVSDVDEIYVRYPEKGLLEDGPNFDPGHPGYDRWILWHYLDSIDRAILLKVYQKLAGTGGDMFVGLDEALLEITGSGLADHLLMMAAWSLRFQVLSGMQFVSRDVSVGEEMEAEDVECLGYTVARINPHVGHVGAKVLGEHAVGVAIVCVDQEGSTTVETAEGPGVAEAIADLPPEATSFVIGANLQFGTAPCADVQSIRIVLSSQ